MITRDGLKAGCFVASLVPRDSYHADHYYDVELEVFGAKRLSPLRYGKDNRFPIAYGETISVMSSLQAGRVHQLNMTARSVR